MPVGKRIDPDVIVACTRRGRELIDGGVSQAEAFRTVKPPCAYPTFTKWMRALSASGEAGLRKIGRKYIPRRSPDRTRVRLGLSAKLAGAVAPKRESHHPDRIIDAAARLLVGRRPMDLSPGEERLYEAMENARIISFDAHGYIDRIDGKGANHEDAENTKETTC